jgi:hypothetical protein
MVVSFYSIKRKGWGAIFVFHCSKRNEEKGGKEGETAVKST